MSAVKVGAHPLVVAVAMGLLAPSTLTEIDDGDALNVSVTDDDFEATQAADVPEPPSSDEFARVENLWHEVRTNIG
jgi:hypothetical protein